MMNPFAWLQMTNMISYQGLVRTFPKATGRHGTGSPCKPPSRVQWSGSPPWMMLQPTQGPNRIRASTARPRFGARTRMFEAGFGQSQGWRRPKYRLRRSVRPVERDEGTREAGGLPGGRLLVLFAKESGLSKVTRQAAQRRRNIFEGKVLASCMAKPCHPSVGWHFAEE